MNPSNTISSKIEAFADRVCDALHVTMDDIFPEAHARTRRYRRQAEARWVVMKACRHVYMMPYKEIGAQFGKDHSTIVHGVQKFDERIKRSREFKRFVVKNFPELLEY